MGFFSKTKQSDEGSGGASEKTAEKKQKKTKDKGIVSDPRKARPWFERAKTVADTGNYDYAIECYISGLRFDADSVEKHESLADVALRRKVVGHGKPAGMIEQMKLSGGKTPLDKMLNAETLWAKDPLNATLMIKVMENAVKAELGEVAFWIGCLILNPEKTGGKTKKDVYLKARDLFVELESFEQAVAACRLALQQEPTNMKLAKELHDLEAEFTVQAGKFGQTDGGVATVTKDLDKQKELEAEDRIAGTADQQEELIARLRQDAEDNLDDIDLSIKYVKALVQTENIDYENTAVSTLEDMFERTGQYRFKVSIGDLKMKQMRRGIREASIAAKQAAEGPAKDEAQERIKQLRSEQLAFELEEYTDRVKNYPTNLELKYELGIRQLLSGDHDAAIGSFQEAQGDPKNRSRALRYLGEAFARKEWFDEAIDTFHRGIEVHPYSDDRIALEMRYELMNSLEQKAARDTDVESAQEAADIASQIAQADFNYRDIQDAVKRIRTMVNELKAAG